MEEWNLFFFNKMNNYKNIGKNHNISWNIIEHNYNYNWLYSDICENSNFSINFLINLLKNDNILSYFIIKHCSINECNISNNKSITEKDIDKIELENRK